MDIDGQVCFHSWLFSNSVKPCMKVHYRVCACADMGGINKDVCAWCQTAANNCLVNCVCFCHLVKAQDCYLCSCGRYNLPLAAHHSPSTYTHLLELCMNYNSCEKVAEIPAVPVSQQKYI